MPELRDSKVSARYILDDKYNGVGLCVRSPDVRVSFQSEWYLGQMLGKAANKVDSLSLKTGQGTDFIHINFS